MTHEKLPLKTCSKKLDINYSHPYPTWDSQLYVVQTDSAPAADRDNHYSYTHSFVHANKGGQPGGNDGWIGFLGESRRK